MFPWLQVVTWGFGSHIRNPSTPPVLCCSTANPQAPGAQHTPPPTYGRPALHPPKSLLDPCPTAGLTLLHYRRCRNMYAASTTISLEYTHVGGDEWYFTPVPGTSHTTAAACSGSCPTSCGAADSTCWCVEGWVAPKFQLGGFARVSVDGCRSLGASLGSQGASGRCWGVLKVRRVCNHETRDASTSPALIPSRASISPTQQSLCQHHHQDQHEHR